MSRSFFVRYGFALGIIAFVVLSKPLIEELVGVGPTLILFVPVVTISAWAGGFGPGLFTTIASILVCSFLYMEPVGTLYVRASQDVLRLGLFFVDGLLTSVLMGQLHAARRGARASAEFAEGLIDTAPVIVLVLDRNGRIIRFNRYCEQITGRSTIASQGLDWFANFVPGETGSRAREAVLRILEGAKGSNAMYPILDANGQEHTVEWANRALGSDPVCVLAIGHDVTELEGARRRALQAERLAAIGQMVAGLAHESRNALQRGQACLELLALRLKGRPDALDLLAGAQDAQDDLHRLYEEVRSYAAPIILDREPCNLRHVLRDAWDRVRATCHGRDLRLTERGEWAPVCSVDAFRVMQVFRNILDNSVAARSDPVEIEVEWTAGESRGRPVVHVSVKDNGPGLSSEQRENVFEPFYTTRTQGTGLGMAIARRIVEKHGGTIAASADEPSGTRIVMTLPRGDA
jgi:PAS domain S-box-containing protein